MSIYLGKNKVGLAIKNLKETIPENEQAPDKAILFQSENSFSLSNANGQKNWDGTIEYSIDNINWQTWNGESINGGQNGNYYRLYLRGSNNTKLSGGQENSRFIFVGTKIKCTGNFQNLLSYQSTSLTSLAPSAFQYLFTRCHNIDFNIILPFTTLANYCYANMFSYCTSLTTMPELFATTLANYCCQQMFSGCTSLVTAPELPATTLANYCYSYMFSGCTSLTTAPELSATTLAPNCYADMFNGCTSLTAAPELPATTLAANCYSRMFYGCTSLTTASKLPAISC